MSTWPSNVGIALSLDVEVWCPKVFAGLFLQFERLAAAHFPTAKDEDLHPNVTYEPLRRLWLGRMALVQSINEGAFQAKRIASQQLQDLVFAHFTASGFMDTGQLNNMYYDLVEAKILEDKSAAERYALAGMIAAMQYLARRFGHDCIINGVDIRDASPMLMLQLESCVRLSLSTSDSRELHEFADAHLWMAYVGAMEEERKRARKKAWSFKGKEIPPRVWFTPRFQNQAQLMGVHTWSEVQAIAERFLYAAFVEPDGALWVDELIKP